MTFQPFSFAHAQSHDGVQGEALVPRTVWSGQCPSGHLGLPIDPSTEMPRAVERHKGSAAGSSNGAIPAAAHENQKGRRGVAAGQQKTCGKSSATAAKTGAQEATESVANRSDIAAGMRRRCDEPVSRPRASSLFSQGASYEAQLTQLIRAQVIPRLAVAHGLRQVNEQPVTLAQKPSKETLTKLADVAIREDSSAVVAYVERLIEQGVPIEDVYVEWLAPAARQMGCDWESDRTDFSSVAIGMWKLQQAMHALSPVFLKHTSALQPPRRVLLASVPGEQHTMGLFMVSEFFRRAGWVVWSELPSDYEDIVGRARGEWFDLIALSVGCDHKLDALTQAIATLRHASRNAKALIMLGGPIVASNPEIAVAVGADFTAIDARCAVARADAAVTSRLTEQFRRLRLLER